MKNKKIIIGVLCALVGIMAVGYAALVTQLNITGIASIDSTWKVEITNITERDVVGDAISKETPSYTATTANFSVGLTQPTDSITYDIEISNLGSLKAKVDSISVSMDTNDAIIYKTEGLEQGDTLGVNEKDTLSVTVTYNPEVTSQPSVTLKEITVTINYVQDLATNNEPSTTYDYVIGDKVSLAGSDWYVIKNSTSDEDYVTLMKEKVLTNAELGEYAANWTTTCGDDFLENGDYGCREAGQIITVPYNTMSYYWSDTCHVEGYYGYTDNDDSGCAGHNDYEGSKIKEFLEETYINVLGADTLKEVDGYKIRLITTDELNTNLGWVNLSATVNTDNENANVPLWVYQNFGDYDDLVWGYWTMTPHSDLSAYEWFIYDTAVLNYSMNCTFLGVRPVINLLKSSI